MRITTTSALASFVFVALACKQGDELDSKMIAETGDDGIVSPDVDLPSGETEGDPEPVLLPTGSCIQFPEPHIHGNVHQCEGSIILAYQADTYSGDDYLTFGPGASNPQYWIEPDRYDLPLVAACCGPFDYDVATFEQKLPYINNCLFDVAQQVCVALPHLLRRQAEMADSEIHKLALNAAADDVEKLENDCLHDLWAGGPTDEDPTRLLNTVWSPKSGVSFTIIDAEVYDWTVEGDVEWNTCESFYDNDAAVIPTAPFEIPGSIAMTQASLAPGTTMNGSGPGGVTAVVVPSTSNSSLTLAQMADGSLRVSGFRLEAGPSKGSFNRDGFEIERSSVLLREVIEPRFAGGEYTVGIGDGTFTVTVKVEGESRIVDFTNADPIVFRQTRVGNWEFDPFDLTYDEPGIGTWTLSFDGLLFRPAV